MPATVVVGTQWGDEGKGKLTDLLARDMDMAINAPIWKMAEVPWKSVPRPTLMAAE